MDKLLKIEILWHGPFTINKLRRDFKGIGQSRGLYQIYGTHNISGPNTLLYIGKANKQSISKRIEQHNNDWMEYEASEIQLFIGILGGQKKIDRETFDIQLDRAERLLINFCSPPYNTQFLNDYGKIYNTIVLNFEKKNRLPNEVSTLYYESNYFKDKWKPFVKIGT